MTDLLRIGVLGPGVMGQQYVRIYAAHPRARVVALCGRTRTRVDELADRYGVPGRYTEFARTVDMGVTLAAIAGAKPLERVDGVVLKSALR